VQGDRNFPTSGSFVIQPLAEIAALAPQDQTAGLRLVRETYHDGREAACARISVRPMPQLPKRRKAAKLLAAPDAAGERLAQVNAARGRHWGTAKGARGKASYVLAVISVPRTRRASSRA
jgi:hypothetical protein